MALIQPGQYFEDYFPDGKYRVLNASQLTSIFGSPIRGPAAAFGNFASSKIAFNTLPRRPPYKPSDDAAPIGRILDWSSIGYNGAGGQPMPIFRGGGRFVGQLIWAGEANTDTTTKLLGFYINLQWVIYSTWSINVEPQVDTRAAEYEALYGPLTEDNPNYKIEWFPPDLFYDPNAIGYFRISAVSRSGSAQFAVAFAENAFAKTLYLNRLYAGDKVIYDGSTGETADGVDITFHDGLGNTIDPTISAVQGATATPKFKRVVYVVFNDFDPYKFNFTVPPISAVISEEQDSGNLLTDISNFGNFWSGNYIGPPAANTQTFASTDFDNFVNSWDMTYTTAASVGVISSIQVTRSALTSYLSLAINRSGREAAIAPSQVAEATIWGSIDAGALADYDIPDPDSPIYGSDPALPLAGWMLNLDFDGDAYGYFYYQPKSGGFERAAACVIYDGGADLVADWETLDQSGSNEHTPVYGGAANTSTSLADRRYIVITCQGPNLISAYGLNENNGPDFAAGLEFEAIDSEIIPTVYTVTGLCMGPLDTTSGVILYTADGSDFIRKVEYTTGGANWSFTSSDWKEVVSEPTGIWYDGSTNKVVVSFASGLCRIYDYDTPTTPTEVTLPTGFRVLAQTVRDNISVASSTFIQRGIRLNDGYCFLVNEAGDQFKTLNITTLVIDTFVTLIDEYTDQWNSVYLNQPAGRAYSWVKRRAVDGTFILQSVIYSAGAGGLPLLSYNELITSLAIKAGFPEGELEFVGTANLYCYGWALYNDADYRNVIVEISQLYNVMVVDPGEGIRFVKAGTDSEFDTDGAIAAADLVDTGDPGALVTSYRLADFDAPVGFEISYGNPFNDFTESTQLAQRPNAFFEVTASKVRYGVSSPVYLDDTMASKLAFMQLYSAVRGRERHGLSSWSKNIRFEPGDIISFPVGENTSISQIEQVTINPDFTLQIEVKEYLQEADTDDTGAGTTPPPVTTPVPGGTSTQSQVVVMDMALPTDSFPPNQPMLFFYLTGVNPTSWTGGSLYHRKGANAFTSIANSGPVYPPIATADEIPVSGDPWVVDSVNTLAISISNGTDPVFVSVTEAQMLAGANLCAYGRDGRWEIMAYTTATPSGSGYILSGLLRGMRGTESFIDTHQVGDLVLPLVQYGAYAYQVVEIGTTYDYKAVGTNESIDAVTAVDHEIAGVSLKCYAPTNLTAELVTGDDIALAWDRRDRNAPIIPFGQPPLSESAEEYEVEILQSGASPTVLRTVTGLSSPSYTYANADVVTDFGSTPAEITFRVYQISQVAAIDRGYPAESTITL